jgi:hypothetical protein
MANFRGSVVAWIEAYGRVKTHPLQNWALGGSRVVLSEVECGLPSPVRPRAQLCKRRVLTRRHSIKIEIKNQTCILWLSFASGRG